MNTYKVYESFEHQMITLQKQLLNTSDFSLNDQVFFNNLNGNNTDFDSSSTV